MLSKDINMKLLIKKTDAKENSAFKKQILEDIEFVTARLEHIRESYDMTSEPELVDALIYEEMAMKSRFDYLIRIARENDIKCRIYIRE